MKITAQDLKSLEVLNLYEILGITQAEINECNQHVNNVIEALEKKLTGGTQSVKNAVDYLFKMREKLTGITIYYIVGTSTDLGAKGIQDLTTYKNYKFTYDFNIFTEDNKVLGDKKTEDTLSINYPKDKDLDALYSSNAQKVNEELTKEYRAKIQEVIQKRVSLVKEQYAKISENFYTVYANKQLKGIRGKDAREQVLNTDGTNKYTVEDVIKNHLDDITHYYEDSVRLKDYLYKTAQGKEYWGGTFSKENPAFSLFNEKTSKLYALYIYKKTKVFLTALGGSSQGNVAEAMLHSAALSTFNHNTEGVPVSIESIIPFDEAMARASGALDAYKGGDVNFKINDEHYVFQSKLDTASFNVKMVKNGLLKLQEIFQEYTKDKFEQGKKEVFNNFVQKVNEVFNDKEGALSSKIDKEIIKSVQSYIPNKIKASSN